MQGPAAPGGDRRRLVVTYWSPADPHLSPLAATRDSPYSWGQPKATNDIWRANVIFSSLSAWAVFNGEPKKKLAVLLLYKARDHGKCLRKIGSEMFALAGCSKLHSWTFPGTTELG